MEDTEEPLNFFPRESLGRTAATGAVLAAGLLGVLRSKSLFDRLRLAGVAGQKDSDRWATADLFGK